MARVWIGQDDRDGMRRLLGLIGQHKLPLLGGVLCMLGFNFFNALPAWYSKDVVDHLRHGEVPTMNRFVLVALAIFLVFTFKGVFFFAHNYMMGLVGQRMIYGLRMNLYSHLHRLSFGFFIRNPAGSLISRFTSDLFTLQSAIQMSILGPFRDIPMIFIFLSMLVYRSWQLAIVSAVVMPLAMLSIHRFGKRNKRIVRERLITFSRMNSLLSETISGIRVVKAFNMEEYEKQRFSQANDELLNRYMRQVKIASYSPPILEIIGAAAGAVIIMFGGVLIIRNTITPGDFVSFLAAFYFLNTPIKRLNGFNLQVQEGLAAARRVFELLDEAPREVDRPGATPLPPITESIEIRVNSFQHEEKEERVLCDVNIRVNAGEVVALVGASGAGKTTLVNLIPRFFELEDGHIFIDGRDIQGCTLASLRSQIAIVTQEIFLFNDTVANNIAYGNIECPQEAIESAAKAAYAHEFIMQMPNGYETVVGEGGLQLSGGQRQRLSIARALIKDAPILILDEATSALDSESEQEVQNAINALIRNRTTIVIAHRLSTIQQANTIYVMDRGLIVEQGRHEELLAIGGLYNKLYQMQFRDLPAEHDDGPERTWRDRIPFRRRQAT